MKPVILLIIAAFATTACHKKKVNIGTEPMVVETTYKEATKDSVILGIDVSHFQGDIDWAKIKSANIRFAYDKAAQGSRYKDPKYAQNKVGARNVGLAHGSYHFFTSNESGLAQAAHFCQVVDYKEGDMPPVLDLEQGSIVNGVTILAFQKEVVDWLNEVERQLGVKPIIYTNHPFGEQYLDHPDFSAYELWIAEYGVSSPKIPKQWKEKGWLIWQRSERGSIEGAIGDVDHDLFNPDRSFDWDKK